MADENLSKEDKQRKENYERIILAIALLNSNILDIDTTTIDDYSKLTPPQKTYAAKVLERHPETITEIEKPVRISEETVTREMASISQTEDKEDLKKIITAGDQRTCDNCRKWQNKIISLSGNDSRYPSLDDAIDDGFLHPNCRCYLARLDLDEIPLKQKINPRYDSRKAARPDLYNSYPTSRLVFN